MAVNWAAQFKKDERDFNGLDAYRQQLIDSPHERITIVAVLEVVRITKDIGDNTTTPTVNTKFVEVMEADDAKAAKALLDGKFARRTGRTDTAPEDLFSVDPDAAELKTEADEPKAEA